jgi:hypothetical protein
MAPNSLRSAAGILSSLFVYGYRYVTLLLSHPMLNEWGFVRVQAVCVSALSLIRNVTFRKESVITERKNIREDLILLELMSDNLSDVPEDIFQ